MDDNGGTTETILTCGRDGAPTRLRCAECQSPICPACYVRTPVGLRCPDCAASDVPPLREAEGRPGWLVPAVVAALLAVGLAAVVFLGGSDESSGPELDLRATPADQAPVRVATGDLPTGRWQLDARRNNGVCATLTLDPGPPAQEHCRPLPGSRHLAFTATGRRGDVYVTWGLVSERTERVRVAPEGSAPFEVPALGGDLNLGGRFFVAYAASQITTFTALAGDGTELGGIRSAPPGS